MGNRLTCSICGRTFTRDRLSAAERDVVIVVQKASQVIPAAEEVLGVVVESSAESD
jgi:hypothetical protein